MRRLLKKIAIGETDFGDLSTIQVIKINYKLIKNPNLVFIFFLFLNIRNLRDTSYLCILVN